MTLRITSRTLQDLPVQYLLDMRMGFYSVMVSETKHPPSITKRYLDLFDSE